MNRDDRTFFWAFVAVLSLVMAVCVLCDCGDNIVPLVDASSPDATIDAQPDAGSEPTTWWYAYLDREQINCEHTQRCDPQALEILFDGSIPDCVQHFATQDCYHNGGPDCSSAYPSARWPLVDQCRAEVAALSCAITVPPDSCEKAFAP